MQEIRRADLEEFLKQGFKQLEKELVHSHCPHSGLRVAAGLWLESGELVTGINYESASYGLTQCAERNAISRAQVEGKIGGVQGILLTASLVDGRKLPDPLTPCGACRQWLCELSMRLQRDIAVYSFWKGSRKGLQGSARNLLPRAFL